MRLRPLFDALRTGADRIAAALDDIARDVQDGHTHRSSQFYTRFLEMFGVVTSAWVLLESATIAARRSTRRTPPTRRPNSRSIAAS